ncbi:MAG: hypothetical protein PHV51_09800, partial [Methanosarcinaceae archaeon]|nr:hypothetical protein [Methanosarcinaceae archaeon]
VADSVTENEFLETERKMAAMLGAVGVGVGDKYGNESGNEVGEECGDESENKTGKETGVGKENGKELEISPENTINKDRAKGGVS